MNVFGASLVAGMYALRRGEEGRRTVITLKEETEDGPLS
jgi:hypothetical protein